MTKSADLHIHTYYSDGTHSPQEVAEQADRAGLNCIAVTDHDTVEGIKPVLLAAQKFDLEVIAGIELSSEINGKDVHILGYLFDYEDKSFLKLLESMQRLRVDRMKKMIDKLKGLGMNNIEFEEVASLAKSDSVGRPHLAAVLKQKGWVATIREAFERFLMEGKPAYVAKYKQTPQEAIKIIRDLKGVAVLAHPMLTGVDELIPEFIRCGLGGLEAYYPNCPSTVINFYEGLARKHNLLVTGGSDSHGEIKKNTYIGKVRIPYEWVEKLKNSAGK